jgi:hypothetical protein
VDADTLFRRGLRGRGIDVRAHFGFILAVTAALVAACGQPGAATVAKTAIQPAHAAHAAAPAIRYLGVYERGDLLSYKPVGEFAAAVGRQPNLELYYSAWYENFHASFARTARRHGAAPFVDLDPEGTSVASIAAGGSDSYLRAYARAVRRFGHSVVISFGHEMNGKWYPWGWTRTPPAVWIEAWRHIVTLFRAAGAKNVTWMWVVNREARGEGPIADWWPGSAYVTWTGIDGYYEKSGQNFVSVFDPTIRAIRALTGKPILISETAIGQVAGQAAKIPGLFAGIRAHHLLGLVWFDKGQRDGSHHQDWRLEGHPWAIAAFRRGLGT